MGLPPTSEVGELMFTSGPLLAADPTLGPWVGQQGFEVVQTGAWVLPDERPLPADLLRFLDAGEPPVYAGFGSMRTVDADSARATILGIRAQGRRVVVGRGWAGLAALDDRDDCFVIGEVNQQELFERVAAVVHHGGAGTTTTAARAGAPQVVVPQAGDQAYWARRVAELGIGAAHDGPTPTVESLSEALETALAPETRARARAVGAGVRTDGAKTAARLLLTSAGGWACRRARLTTVTVAASQSACPHRLMGMTNTEQTSVLITGGNKGLGLEAARRLGEKGWKVFLGSRDEGGEGQRPRSWLTQALTWCRSRWT